MKKLVVILGLGLPAVFGGCTDSCPTAAQITFADGTTTTVDVGSGAASQANSVWAFYAAQNSGAPGIFGTILPGTTTPLFRAEYGANGRLLRFFDNQALAPDSFGPEIVFDAAVRAMAKPGLTYAAQSYGAEKGTAVGNFVCLHVYSQPIDILQATLQFTGTRNDLLRRIDGNLHVVTEINPAYASQAPPNAKSETVDISVFALKEN